MKQNLKSKKKRTLSQRQWLTRQINDPYVEAAKRQGYRSRAAFKLEQLDDKFRFLSKGARVADLGAAPGGWTQVAVQRVKAGTPGGGHVAGLDILPMDAVPGAIILLGDFLAEGSEDKLKEALGGPCDVVMSDMAAPTTGHAPTDHLRIMHLAETALEFALGVLAPGGTFIAKLFQGGAEKDLLDALKKNFQTVRHAKPAASRQDSKESYVVAMGFRGERT
jgi:23S rRNA (uridine2552-2'-O)-methyltransferase